MVRLKSGFWIPKFAYEPCSSMLSMLEFGWDKFGEYSAGIIKWRKLKRKIVEYEEKLAEKEGLVEMNLVLEEENEKLL